MLGASAVLNFQNDLGNLVSDIATIAAKSIASIFFNSAIIGTICVFVDVSEVLGAYVNRIWT